MRSAVFWRAALASLLLCGFSLFVFPAAKVPGICPPPYAGSMHAWVSVVVLAGVLVGAAFFPWVHARCLAWGCAVSFIVFEVSFGFPLGMPTVPQRWTRALELAGVAGLISLLISGGAWLDERRRDVEKP